MSIESMMYFALGAFAAALLALLIMPAVWKRAVRLTTKRIEAATPITLAEFRADKDQLRAEFALATRRLEMNVEALRKRLSDQLRDINRKKSDISAIKGEHDTHLTIIRELEEREGELRRRILELEKEGADLAQRLRMRDREFAEKAAQLESTRDALKQSKPATFAVDGKALSGEYNKDVEELLTALTLERKRAEFLETQNRSLIAQLESSEGRSSKAVAAAAELRESLAEKDNAGLAASNELVAAEARIADAENRLSTLLTDTATMLENGEQRAGQLLAEKLSLEEELEKLRTNVQGVEGTILADWDSDRIEQGHLRERLNDIAANVSRLVYALDGTGPVDTGESLFDRVQKFADEGSAADGALPPGRRPANGGAVSDRLAALRDLQDRN